MPKTTIPGLPETPGLYLGIVKSAKTEERQGENGTYNMTEIEAELSHRSQGTVVKGTFSFRVVGDEGILIGNTKGVQLIRLSRGVSKAGKPFTDVDGLGTLEDLQELARELGTE